ncbi:diacylglycerol kinase [Methylicorpusculum oleiharenae]
METRQNEKIRVIKDIAAAATGISILIWAVVLVSELSHLWSFVVSVF